MAGRRATRVLRGSFEAREVDDLAQKVRGAVALPLAKIAKLCPPDLEPAARARLIAELETRGLERTAKVVRVPLEEQLSALLGPGERVPPKSLAKRIKGASAAELKQALAAQVAAGGARVVVRGKAEALVGGAERVLDRQAIARLTILQRGLTDLCKKLSAKGGPRTVLADDIELLFADVARFVGGGRPPERDARDVVRAELDRLARGQHGLVSIPALVRAVRAESPSIAAPAVHAVLLEEERQGRVELRVETSVGSLLSAEDRALCAHASTGALLSYALVLHGGGA